MDCQKSSVRILDRRLDPPAQSSIREEEVGAPPKAGGGGWHVAASPPPAGSHGLPAVSGWKRLEDGGRIGAGGLRASPTGQA